MGVKNAEYEPMYIPVIDELGSLINEYFHNVDAYIKSMAVKGFTHSGKKDIATPLFDWGLCC